MNNDLMNKTMLCNEHYKRAVKGSPLPCPIHGTLPLILIDITTRPHQGKALCQNVNCKLKVVTEPENVIREWNKLCK